MAELRSAIFWVLNCPIYLLRCYITDPVEIAMRGVMTTPAIAVNGKVVGKGLISAEQIQPLLQN
jgi:hypothetical protein